MKKALACAGWLACLFFFYGCEKNPDAFPVLKGPYLGQKPPGTTPELFAPGIVSTELNTRDTAVSADGKEIFFSVNAAGFAVSTILVTREQNGAWTKPEVLEHMDDPRYANGEPFLSADGKKLYFYSNRPRQARNEAKGDEDIWVMERAGEGWGEPVNLGPPVNSDGGEFFPSLLRDGTIYFTRREKSGLEHIMRSRFRDGRYLEPEPLPAQVNAGQARFNAFVAPDESFIIVPVYGLPETLGETDYYVSFRNPDDTWSEPVNMGESVNTPTGGEYSAALSSDGKYLFFTSSRGLLGDRWPEKLSADFLHGLAKTPGQGNTAVYWIDARIIETLRPRK